MTAKKAPAKKKPTAKKTAVKKKTVAKKAAEPKLHYDKEVLLEEYNNTFKVALWTAGTIIGFALIYFFALATYLGGWSHTKHEPFVKTFGDEIEIEYDGLKLPIYGEE